MKVDLTNLFNDYKNSVLHSFEETSSFLCKSEFKSFNLDVNSLEQFELSHFRLKNSIYYFEIEACQDFTKLKNEFEKLKELNKTIKYPKINSKHFDDKSTILYVGKSTNPLKNRLETHFGKKSRSTYAMHMDTWSNYLKELKITFHVCTFSSEINDEALELIESSLHHALKPLLGRKGH